MVFITQIKKYGMFYGSEGLELVTIPECAISESSETPGLQSWAIIVYVVN
jgi:hypothetical protein